MGLPIPGEVSENMVSFLECFGNIEYDEETVMVIPKEDKEPKLQKGGKDIPIKKPTLELAEEKKPVPKLLKKASFLDFNNAIKTYKQFDLTLKRLGLIKSASLEKEVSGLQRAEEKMKQRELE